MGETINTSKSNSIEKETLIKAFRLMSTAKFLTEKYEENKELTSKYVHATSRGLSGAGLASGVVCQFRVVGTVHFSPVTRIKSLRTPNKCGL